MNASMELTQFYFSPSPSLTFLEKILVLTMIVLNHLERNQELDNAENTEPKTWHILETHCLSSLMQNGSPSANKSPSKGHQKILEYCSSEQHSGSLTESRDVGKGLLTKINYLSKTHLGKKNNGQLQLCAKPKRRQTSNKMSFRYILLGTIIPFYR